MMKQADDEDLLQQRASTSALKRLQKEIAAFEARRKSFLAPDVKEQKKLYKYTMKITALFDQFQEEPQLLDPHLRTLIPPLTDAFVILVVGEPQNLAALSAIAGCLSTLCKVRGAKVVVRFMDNEVRYIQPFVDLTISFIRSSAASRNDKVRADSDPATNDTEAQAEMQLRYILLLWLSHLMLTPFPLSSVGSVDHRVAHDPITWLPEDVPSIAEAVVRIAIVSLSSSANDQWCAARALVNLSLRPDMRKVGILDRLMKDLVSTLATPLNATLDVHTRRGSLSFIDGLLRAANSDDVSRYLPSIFQIATDTLPGSNMDVGEAAGSAMLKRISIKILRLVIVHLLQGAASREPETRGISARMIDEEGSHQEAIAYLLEALADRDTQVRLAASKALAVVTAKLDPELAEQVVDAVLDAFNENTNLGSFEGRSMKDFSNVSATKWHGLTLTLSHMLFRRSIASQQLPGALEALYSSLTFEQRSSSGSSLGGNVRDAANFGLWSLARRYKTSELLPIRLDLEVDDPGASAIQRTATELLVAACLDSAGNVRRGSSAALQELIGRHPDTVFEGIAVVQRVDYHAVGLRRRAMVNVAHSAASLASPVVKTNPYLQPIWEGLLGWRGVGAPDAVSREHAAAGLQRLVLLLEGPEARRHVDGIVEGLRRIRQQDVDRRHGLMLALASVLTAVHGARRDSLEDIVAAFTPSSSLELWSLFRDSLRVVSKMLGTKSMKPDLITAATVTLIRSIAAFYGGTAMDGHPQDKEEYPPPEAALETFTTCLRTADPATLEVIPGTCTLLRSLLPRERRHALRQAWEEQLKLSSFTPRRVGLMVAIVSMAFAERLDDRSLPNDPATEEPWLRARKMILDIFDTVDDVDARIVSLRCAAILRQGPEECKASLDPASQSLLFVEDASLDRLLEDGLNDYTINERGDEGSRVRLAALETLMRIYSVERTSCQVAVPHGCKITVQRLALERLDKVRASASRALAPWQPHPDTNLDITSEDYFYTIGQRLLDMHTQSDTHSPCSESSISAIATAFWTGISSSTGAGSDTLIETARSALYSILDDLPSKTLSNILSALLPTLKSTIENKNDRVLLPLLETISFLLDAGVFERLVNDAGDENFKWTTLLSLVQKAHFKSSSLEKVGVCVKIYWGLVTLSAPTPSLPAPPGGVPRDASPESGSASADGLAETAKVHTLATVRKATLRKLTTMLTHSYPKIRIAVAEVLYVVSAPDLGIVGDAEVGKEVQAALRDVDWGSAMVGEEAERRRERVGRVGGLLRV